VTVARLPTSPPAARRFAFHVGLGPLVIATRVGRGDTLREHDRRTVDTPVAERGAART
jgi:hypothetical protein